MHYAEFKMMHFYQDTFIIQTIYNILQKCEQWERQPISLNTSSWLTNVQRLATAVRVMAGFSDYSFKIFTLRPTPLMRMSRCVARRNCSGSRQQGPKSTLGSCRITDLACMHSSMCAKGPCSVNTGGCKGYTAATAKRLHLTKARLITKKWVWGSPASEINLSVFPFLMHLVTASNPLRTFLLRITRTWAGCTLFWTVYLSCHTFAVAYCMVTKARLVMYKGGLMQVLRARRL